MEKIQVDILGLSTSPASGGAFALILKETSGTRRLPIIIGAFEAQAIAIELENIKPPRPLTHDLAKAIIENLNSSVSEVIISDLKEGTFYATVILETLTGEIEIDARPSDAIAIGVRFSAPIYVDDEILREAGFEPEPEAYQDQNKAKSPKKVLTKEDILKKLQTDLEDSIKNEDYEKAIKIRDDIQNLNIGN